MSSVTWLLPHLKSVLDPSSSSNSGGVVPSPVCPRVLVTGQYPSLHSVKVSDKDHSCLLVLSPQCISLLREEEQFEQVKLGTIVQLVSFHWVLRWTAFPLEDEDELYPKLDEIEDLFVIVCDHLEIVSLDMQIVTGGNKNSISFHPMIRMAFNSYAKNKQLDSLINLLDRRQLGDTNLLPINFDLSTRPIQESDCLMSLPQQQFFEAVDAFGRKASRELRDRLGLSSHVPLDAVPMRSWAESLDAEANETQVDGDLVMPLPRSIPALTQIPTQLETQAETQVDSNHSSQHSLAALTMIAETQVDDESAQNDWYFKSGDVVVDNQQHDDYHDDYHDLDVPLESSSKESGAQSNVSISQSVTQSPPVPSSSNPQGSTKWTQSSMLSRHDIDSPEDDGMVSISSTESAKVDTDSASNVSDDSVDVVVVVEPNRSSPRPGNGPASTVKPSHPKSPHKLFDSTKYLHRKVRKPNHRNKSAQWICGTVARQLNGKYELLFENGDVHHLYPHQIDEFLVESPESSQATTMTPVDRQMAASGPSTQNAVSIAINASLRSLDANSEDVSQRIKELDKCRHQLQEMLKSPVRSHEEESHSDVESIEMTQRQTIWTARRGAVTRPQRSKMTVTSLKSASTSASTGATAVENNLRERTPRAIKKLPARDRTVRNSKNTNRLNSILEDEDSDDIEQESDAKHQSSALRVFQSRVQYAESAMQTPPPIPAAAKRKREPDSTSSGVSLEDMTQRQSRTSLPPADIRSRPTVESSRSLITNMLALLQKKKQIKHSENSESTRTPPVPHPSTQHRIASTKKSQRDVLRLIRSRAHQK